MSSADPNHTSTGADVDVDQDMDIDPAIAQAMGFSGFGMQGSKKRKHGAAADDDHFSFVDARRSNAATGANATAHSLAGGNHKQPDKVAAEAMETETGRRQANATTSALDAEGKPTLDALRRGVRNAEGDMVYFLPSFIEDPWSGLEGRR